MAVKGKNSDTPVRVVSSLPNIVQVLDDRRLVGRAEGNTRVEVIQGTEIVGVEITVKNKPPRAIAFAPSAVAVRVDDAVSLRVVAELDSQKTFDVAPDVLEWIGMPRPDYASLDKAGLRVRGLKTTGDDRETLVVRFGGREARAVLEVLSAPLRLELAPSGPLKIPAGQKLPLKLWATYGDGNRQEIASDRVEWTWTPVPGLSLDSGALQAEKAGVGPVTLIAAYQGTPSNEVEVRTTPAEPLKLKLTAKPERLAKGKTGLIEVAASTDSGPVTLREQLLTFESSNPDSLQVTPGTGQFRAEVDGVATITAKASTGETATVEITVGEQPEVEQPKTKSVRIVSVQPLPVKVPVGVEFTDFRIEAVSAEGAARDVTEETPPILAFTGMAEEAPLVLREGKLLAVRSGAIQLTASFDGVTAEKPLEISVVEELQVDEIRISLAAVRLAVGESTELVAEGFVKGKSVGILTSHPRITWKSRSGEGVLKVNGSQVTALNAGESGVTAQLDEVVSAVTAVTVVEDAKDISVPLQVSPATLTLRAEDSRVVGTGIKVTRSGVDFATQVQVTPADLEVVVYDPELRRLTAVAPGRTLVAYAAGGQLVQQTVVVTEAEIPTPDSRVEIEPNGGTLAVGERLNLRGLQVCGKCKSPRAGRTSSMALTSSDPAVCAVDGVSIVGLKTGKVLISARLPGVDAAATATFVVVDTKFDRLVIVPPAINLSLGGQSHFNVYGLTASGRRLLGDHPGLTLTLEGPEASSVELNAAVRSVSAVAPGRAQLVARWSDSSNAQLAQIQIPVNVKGDQVRAIRLVPEDGSIPEGQTQIYQVFVQRGANWLPLAISDGVTLRSSKNNVARVKDSLQADALEVEAVKAGVVLVTAHYSNRRAEARLTVVPPDPIPNTPNNSPGAPSGRPVGLQFIPNLFRLEMGTPGDSIRVVRVYSDGRQEDVDHLATVTVRDPQDVITIEPTTSGPVVRPKRIGQTQLDATLGGLRTESPLLIDVVAAGEQRTARLRVHPNPMRLQKGETGVIGVVEVVPARGGRPFSPNYKLSASPSPVIVADDGRKSIRGLTAGNAVATVTVLDPGGGYDGLSTNIPVEVIDPAAPPPLPAPSSVDLINPELQLSGPDETTVGAEVQLQVERVHGDSGVVVNSEAQLSLPAAEQEFAKFAPGCKLVALKPGTVHLQARFEGLVSKVHELKVGPPHPRGYERLKLEVEEKPLSVGDIRDYKLWGYPQGGGPREDLTNQVRLDNTDPFPPHLELTVLKPSAEATVVTHKPPRLIAAAPGQVQLQASVGSLKSNPVELSVSSIEPDEMGKQLIQIRIEPPKTVIREGEKTPQFRVLVRSRGSSTFREVDNAKLESLDSALLTMTADDARRFTAVKAGETRVQATFGEKSDTAEIKIVPDRFREVVDRNLEIRKQNFLLQLDVAASASAQKVEYRIIVPETREHSDWKPAEPKGGQMTVSLKTPLMVLGPNSQTYRLHLEARDVGSNAVERYPFSFQIKNSATVERKN